MVYFLVYYRSLDLIFSKLTFFSILLLTGFFVSLSLVFMHTSWRIGSIVLFFLTSLYSLVNFAYIQVFSTFLDPEFGQNMYTLISTASEFYSTIPLHIYLLTLSFFIFSATLIVLHSRTLDSVFTTTFHGEKTQPQKSTEWKRVFSTCSACLLISSTGFYHADFYSNNPKEDWWNSATYVADYGIYGHIIDATYKKVYSFVTQDKKDILGYSDIAVEKKEAKKTPYAVLRSQINTLNSQLHINSAVLEKKNILPRFSSKPHIIIYQLESVSSWGMENGANAMPFLVKKRKESVHTDSFYPNGCHTIDAEFASLCSFYPHGSRPIPSVGAENQYTCLPQILSEEYSYNTAVFHANRSEFWSRDVLGPKWGFNNMMFMPKYPYPKIYDGVVLKDAVEYIEKSDAPVFAQIIGYSSHAPHIFSEMKSHEEKSGIPLMLYSGDLPKDIVARSELRTETDVRAYLGFLTSIDNAIKELFSLLETKKLINNTIVVITTDHRYYGFNSNNLEDFYAYNETPFMMHVPGLGGKKVADIATHIDIAPSLLHLLEGESYMPNTQFLGTSLFSDRHPNHAFLTCHNISNLIHPELVLTKNNNNGTQNIRFAGDGVTPANVVNISRNMDIIHTMRNAMIEENMTQ